MYFRWMAEERPGPVWRESLDRFWPAYRSWFLGEGDAARPDLETCRAELVRHMPEVVSLWERLVDLADGDGTVARMLSLVDPAPYVTGCSQGVRMGRRPVLVRNYDYRPDACEGVFLLSRWHDTKVLAATDCLWGALDGINEHGLCVALSFGGSRVVGRGFGIPLILRYILEFCRTVREASAVLRRVPCHMAYNVSLLDAGGEYAVAYLHPGRGVRVSKEQVSTNHQKPVEWKEYTEATHSRERRMFLEEQVERKQSVGRFIERFLEPPLYATGHDRGYGTLYTVAYTPHDLSATFLWPHHRVQQSIGEFAESELRLSYSSA